MSEDTSEEMKKKQMEFAMSKTPGERFMMGIEMYEMAKSAVVAAIKRENENISELELRKEVFRRFYRNDFSEEEMEEILANFK